MKTEEHFKEYDLLIGESSIDIFDHYKTDYIHGLYKDECESYVDTKEDAYIAGLANTSPNGTKPFVFINSIRLVGDYRDITLIMHEMIHLSLLLHDWNMDLEEEMITWAEKETNKIIKAMKKRKIPEFDPQTGELNPRYEELTGEPNPLSSAVNLKEIETYNIPKQHVEDMISFSNGNDYELGSAFRDYYFKYLKRIK